MQYPLPTEHRALPAPSQPESYENEAIQAASQPSSTAPPTIIPELAQPTPEKQPLPTPPVYKMPAAELTPEAIALARRRSEEPESIRPVAHVVALEDLTPGREAVPAATVHPVL